jgi:hypothetical protein
MALPPREPRKSAEKNGTLGRPISTAELEGLVPLKSMIESMPA